MIKGIIRSFTVKPVIIILLFLIFRAGSQAQPKHLEYFLDKAVHDSPLLKDYLGQISLNRIDSMKIAAGYGPQVNGLSNSYYAPVVKGWGFDEITTDKVNLDARVSVSKELTGRRSRENQFRSLHIQNQALLDSRKVSEQELVKEVTDLYISAYESFLQIRYNTELFGLLIKEDAILRKLTQENVYTQADYLTFQVVLHQQDLAVVQALNDYRRCLSGLNYLCGMDDTTTVDLAEPQLILQTIPEVRQSVFYQAFVSDSLKLKTEDQQVDLGYRPRISLFGDAGYFSTLGYHPWKNFGTMAGVNLTVPIYDGNQRKMLHDKYLIQEQNRQNYRDFYVKQFRQQVNQLYQQLMASQNLGSKLEEQVTYALTLTEVNHRLLETGEVRIADYILAVNNLMTARNALTQNRMERYRLINLINYWSRTK